MFVGERLRLSQENRATRGKMEQLQVMMEERRQRRKARREARTAPYSTWGPNRSTLAGNKLTPPASPHPTQPLKEQQQSMEVDVETSNVSENNVTDGYTELTHETVVAWGNWEFGPDRPSWSILVYQNLEGGTIGI